MTLDIRTLVVMNCLINTISAWAMAVIWMQNRRRYAGIHLWLWDMVLQAVGMGCIMLRGLLPDIVSIVAANTMLMLGAVLLLFGLRQFVGKKGFDPYNCCLLGLFVVLVHHYAIVAPDLTKREIVIIGMIVCVVCQVCWLIFRRINPEMRRIMRIIGGIMTGYAVVSLARVLLLIVFPKGGNEFFRPDPVTAVSFALYASLSVGLTVSLILMVNRRLLSEVTAQEEKFTKAFHGAPQAILLSTMADGRIFEINESFTHITGYQPSEVVGRTTGELRFWLRPEDRAAVAAELAAGRPVRGREVLLTRKSGQVLTGLFSADALVINGEACLISSVSDISELGIMKARLEELATHDPLTGLANRLLFQQRFDLAVAECRRHGRRLAVLSLDLDRFKAVNDSLGHPVGDMVLVEAAARLRAVLRHADTAARFGGDEFVLLAVAIGGREDAVAIARKILGRFREPFRVAGHDLALTVSIGVAVFPDDAQDCAALIQCSDARLYRAKGAGRNTYDVGEGDTRP